MSQPRPEEMRGIVQELRLELSHDPERPISQERFAQLLNVSWSSVARWERGQRPEVDAVRKIMRLKRVLEALGELVVRDYRLAFLEQNHPQLLNLRPVDLLNTEEGTAAVLRVIEAAESGAFA